MIFKTQSSTCSLSLTAAICVLAILLPGRTSAAGEAKLYRDSWGVPHIWAEDYASAGYAIGQGQCQDSLNNVIYCLYAGVGRLSELFGPGLLKADLETRKLRHAFYAQRDWPRLKRPMRQLIEGYCAGVNDYVKTHPKELPIPVEPVTPVQVVAWHRSLLMLSAVGICKADAEASKADGYHPIYNPRNVGKKRPGKNAKGSKGKKHPGIPPGKSNSWVLSGSRTASGAPMLLIDPHWMAVGHLQLYESGYDITGGPAISRLADNGMFVPPALPAPSCRHAM